MKKTVLMLAAVLLLTGLFTACSSEEPFAYDYDLSEYVELGNYGAVRASFKNSDEITQEEMDEMLYQIRLAHATFDEEKDVAEKYDQVTVDLKVLYDGVSVKDAAQEDYKVILGLESVGDIENALRPALIGKRVGDAVQAETALSANQTIYGDLAGKTVLLSATVKKIHAPDVPELDVDFVLSITQGEFGDVSSFVEDLRISTLSYRWEEKQTKVLDAFMESCRVLQYPEKEMNEYKKQYRTEVETQASLYGMAYDQYVTNYMKMTFQEAEEQYNQKARRQVKADMVMLYLPRVMGTTLSEEEYQMLLQSYFEADGESVGVSSAEEYEKKFTRESLTRSFLWDKSFMEVLESAVPVEE